VDDQLTSGVALALREEAEAAIAAGRQGRATEAQLALANATHARTRPACKEIGLATKYDVEAG
jgi:hypothetical protein